MAWSRSTKQRRAAQRRRLHEAHLWATARGFYVYDKFRDKFRPFWVRPRDVEAMRKRSSATPPDDTIVLR